MKTQKLAKDLRRYAQHGEVPPRRAAMELAAEVLEQFDGETEFWTFWHPEHVCSRHKTLAAAERAATECEVAGGARHTIYAVKKVKRSA